MPAAPRSGPAQKLPCFRLFVYVNYNGAFNDARGRAEGGADRAGKAWAQRMVRPGLGTGDAPGPLAQGTRAGAKGPGGAPHPGAAGTARPGPARPSA